MEMTQGSDNVYVPRRKRWHKVNWIISKFLYIIQLAFDYSYDKVMRMKVDRKYRNKWRVSRISCGIQHIFVNDTRISNGNSSQTPRLSAFTTVFDTDANAIGIDNRCSACLSNDINDFIGPVTKTNRRIKGFGGEALMDVYMGTIIWKWLDDEGLEHRFKILKSYYVRRGGCHLLSPQHWAKTQPKSTKREDRWYQVTYSNKCTMHWGKYTLTVPISKHDNVATFYSVPGYRKVRTKKKIDVVANQVRILKSKPIGTCCEVIVNEAKHRSRAYQAYHYPGGKQLLKQRVTLKGWKI